MFEVPPGVAARIRSRIVLGGTQSDQGRFPPTAVGCESLDDATAQNRIDIEVQGGVGSLKVMSGSGAAAPERPPPCLLRSAESFCGRACESGVPVP